MKVREIISEVRNNLRSIDPDSWFPAKFIYFKIKGIASLFIKREADDKRLFRYTSLFTTIKCLEMQEQDLINCCDIRIPNCNKVMVSKEDLPETYSTRFGYLLNVTSVDYDTDYTPTSPQQFKFTQSREFIDQQKRYFWLENKKLVVPIVGNFQLGPERLTVKGMFINKVEALRLDKCTKGPGDCILFMDQEFVAPEHLLDDIKKATVIDILKTNRQIPADELADMNSNNKAAKP